MSNNNLPNDGTVTVGKFQFRYSIEGSGLPALVIGSAIYYPRIFSQNLRQHLKLVFIDHKGFAPSPGLVDISAFELERLLEDIEDVRLSLGLEQVIIIGHSGHGYMALEYAKKYPQHVSHVVMIGLGPNNSAASQALAEQYLQETASPERKAALIENQAPALKDEKLSPSQQFINYYIRNAARIWYDFQFDATPLWDGVEINMPMFEYVWGTVFANIDITKGLDKLDKPVFLALGRYDYLCPPPSSWAPIRSKFKDLTLRVFEKSGHTPPLEEATLFDQELLKWVFRTR